MKKLLIIFVVIVSILLTTSVTVFAEPGVFVQSPSVNGAPVLIEENSDKSIKITAYRNRKIELNAPQIDEFEQAYKSIVGVNDLTVLDSKIAAVAEGVKVDIGDLAVSDLFYLSLKSGADHVDGTTYKVSVQAETFANFICLLKYDNGEWTVVENVEVKGTKVVDFVADDLGPYAVVVSVGDAPDYPDAPKPDTTVGPWTIMLYILLICTIAAGIFLIIVIIFKSKREKNEDDETQK